MKMLLVLISVPFIISFAQDNGKQEPTVNISGFIKNDFFFDSRQTSNFREGHFLLYPENKLPDEFGKDINAKSSLNALSIQSRITGKFNGPDVLGGKLTGMLEGEFFGTSNADINGFRLRHAFINLKWENTALLMGQTWNPMFITAAFPQVVSFNTGSPFQPFSRNPQIKLTQSFNNIDFIAAVIMQRDFTSPGPGGFSSMYLRNSVLPELDFQIQYKTKSFFAGAGIDYKSLIPSIETTKNVFTDERVSGISSMLYLKIISGEFKFLAEGVYGQNLADLLMLGGYAVTSVDTVTGFESYTPLDVYSIWVDVSYGEKLQPGIFAGFTKNLGASNEIVGAIYGRSANIDKVFRVSPRIIFNVDCFRFAFESELTTAYYGSVDKFGKVENSEEVLNFRVLFATYFFF